MSTKRALKIAILQDRNRPVDNINAMLVICVFLFGELVGLSGYSKLFMVESFRVFRGSFDNRETFTVK